MTDAITIDGLTFEPPGAGVWQRDEDHWPRPVPRSYTEVYLGATVPYVKEWCRRYGLLMDHFEPGFVHGFGYGQIHPVGERGDGGGSPPPKPIMKVAMKVHPEMRARRKAAEQALAERLWLTDLKRWDDEAKPKITAENRRNAAVDRAALDDPALLDHLEVCRETLRRFIGLHHRFNGAMFPVGLLMVAMGEWTGDPQPVLDLLEGASPVSSGRSEELTALAAAIRDDDEARRALEADDPEEALARLAADDGAVGAAYRDYLETVGYRLVGDSIEHGNPTLVELPALMRRTIRTEVEGGRQGPSRDEIAERAAELRGKVPAEHRGEFDRLLEDTLATYRLRDERSVLADVWAAGVFRQGLLEFGRRLADRGRLAEPVHLVDATFEEVRALADGGGPSAEQLADRARFRAEHADFAAPPVLGGEPPPPPPMDVLPPAQRRLTAAIMVQIAGIFNAGEAQSDPGVVKGTPASAGSYQGTARVLAGPEEMDRIEPGDVLVARTTSEAFNVVLPLLGAIVTDRGGVLSHAAIVSRETGIPCVVGCGEATARIGDGTEVFVDGSAGEVKLH